MVLLVLVVVLTLVFTVTNGLHDTSVAVAGSVSTRTLTPGVALALAAFFSALGSLVGVGVVWTVSRYVVQPPAGNDGLLLLLAGVVAAIVWNLLTWWRGLPTSSTYALVGGLLGAAVTTGSSVHWSHLLAYVIIPLVGFPLVAFGVSYLSMVAVIWAAHRRPPEATNRRFRVGQAIAACAVALGHGIQDGQKAVGVMVMALGLAGHGASGIPAWVRLSVALAMGSGTMLGGWRIMRTVGRRIVALDPAKGFVSEASAAGILVVAAGLLGAPVSTTYAVTSSLVGVGMVRGWRRVRWQVVQEILVAAALTLPATGVLGAALSEFLIFVVGMGGGA